MATQKSTTTPRKRAVKQSTKPTKAGNEMVQIPVLAQPHAKAPATDPYLQADTVTAEQVSVCGYDLPPILRGIQPGRGFDGESKDYPVKVIWMNRRQINAMMAAVSRERPELAQMLEIMKAFMCYLDTMRDEASLGIVASLGFMKKHMPADSPAFSNMQGVMDMLGRWNDERRLMLY